MTLNTTRRAFLKAGVTAGAGLAAAVNGPEPSFGETSTVTTEFEAAGATGMAVLEVEDSIPAGAAFNVDVTPLSRAKACVRLRFQHNQTLAVRRFSVTVSVPLRDLHRVWYTQQIDGLGQHAYISLPWGATIPAGGHQGSFIAEVQSRFGRNRGLAAFRDQTGDGSVNFRVEYGGTRFHMTLSRFATDRPYTARGIDEVVYIDCEDIPWSTAVKEFVRWYDREHGLITQTPSFCYEPAFNTWYPLKQKQYEKDILRLAGQCRRLGVRTFEVDDGWFVNTGTWQTDTGKIPDLRDLVSRLRDMGLRVLVWYRPFHSGGVPELEWLGTVENGSRTHDLCVRTREVQERAARIAADLMERYGLDGLKIDFLDASTVKFINCTADHEHVTDFVSDGSRAAMRLMAEAVRGVKKDAVIEYRLNYANVANRGFATIYRGQDAPSDPDHIRRHLALMRSWTIGVAPHSDYAYWTPDLDDTEVARFMAGICLYGVPTLSVDFDTLPESHFAIAKAWLDFYTGHRELLFSGEFEPLSNDAHYSAARVSAPGTTFIPVFLERWPSVIPVSTGSSGVVFMFNGTAYPEIVTTLEGVSGTYALEILDCKLKSSGEAGRIESDDGKLVLNCAVPVGGALRIRRV